MKRTRVYSETPWESSVGYCRAIRADSFIAVSGSAPVAIDGGTFAPGDAYAQTRRCLEIIETALRGVGATRRDVIRTRMFVTDITRWEEYGRAHQEFFGNARPATSMVEVRRLIEEDMLIEIECDAIAASDR
jgi:isochorismate pyruvate lyase